MSRSRPAAERCAPASGGAPSDPSPTPPAVVSRLSLYLRELQRLAREGCERTNSTQLGQLLGLSDAQVRKDLAYFGQFGHPGVGYHCDELIQEVKRILGTDRKWPVALVGTGNLGRALLGYKGFAHQGFEVVAAFDADQTKIGGEIDGVRVYHLDDLGEVVRQKKIRLAMIAVTAAAAQPVADGLVRAGIEGIMNFAPVRISIPSRVRLVSVDLAVELEQLSFAVVNSAGNT